MLTLVYIILSLLYVLATPQYPSLDLKQPGTLQFRGDFSTSDQYILLVAAESTRKGNFFYFAQSQAKFPYFIKTYDIDILSRTFAFSIGSSTIDSSQDCTTGRNSITCSKEDTDDACMCFKTTGTADCIRLLANKLQRHCTDPTTYLDVEVLVAEVVPQGLSLSSSGPVTFHYLSISPAQRTSWLVTIAQEAYWSYPKPPDEFQPAISFLDDVSTSPSPWPSSMEGYRTIIKTQLIKHDNNQDLFCRYRLSYNGLIRGIYINDYPTSAHGNPESLDAVKSIESSLRFPLRAFDYNLITIIGLNILTTDLEFIDCALGWQEDITIETEFQYFYYSDQPAFPDNSYTISSGNIICGDNCAQCISSDMCIQCMGGFLYQGKCLDKCPPEALYPDYKGFCSPNFESMSILQQSTIDDLGAQVSVLIDRPDQTFAMILHPASQIIFGNSPLVWATITPYSLVESITQIVNVQGGSHSVRLSFNSIADSSIVDSDKLHVVYYPIQPGRFDMNLYQWQNEPQDPETLGNPVSVTVASTLNQNYLDPTLFYVFELILNCIAECNLNVISDGRVIVIKNDRTLLFDNSFISRWKYTYSKPIQGTVHLLFKVSNAHYFKADIQGQNYQTYRKTNPIGDYILSPLSKDINNCNIENCNNCELQTCYSCNEGFYLDTNNQTCVLDCNPSKNFKPERICATDCGETSLDDNSGYCLPSCNTPGVIYSDTLGCQTCVEGCNICSSSTTCKTCLFQDENSTDTFCSQKGGSVYTTPDFTLGQTLNINANREQVYAVILADMSKFVEGTLYFINQERQIPRIIGIYQMTQASDSTQQATIPPLSISESGSISIHYVELIPDPTGSTYSLTGFMAKTYLDWPLFEDIPQIDSANSPFAYESSTGLFKSIDEYQTVIAQKMYSHDQPNPITCQARVKYSGYIRSLYVNGGLLFFDSTIDLGANIEKEAVTRSITLEANAYSLLTITGYKFQISSFGFENCFDLQSQPVTPVFNSFVLKDSGVKSDTFLATQNTFCDNGCLACLGTNQCTRCSPGLYLQDGKCRGQCDPAYPLGSVFGLCDNTVRNHGLESQLPSYNTEQQAIAAQYNLVLKSSIDMIAVAFPFQISFGKFPGLVKGGNDASLAEATYSLVNYQSDNVTLAFNIPVKPSSLGTFTDVNFALYATKKDAILLSVWPQAFPAIIDFQSPESYEYVSRNNNSFSLLASKTYYFSFFLNCLDICQIELNSGGYVTIQANYRTFVLNAALDPSFPAYKLQRKFQGLTFLEIYVWGSQSFNFKISGNYAIFSYNQYILSDKISIPSITQCPSTCVNCYQGQCLSCNPGSFLTADTAMCETCPYTQSALLEERFCTVNSCQSLNLMNNDGTCQRICPNPGFYYSITSGCINNCDKKCMTCLGPNINDCLSCNPPFVLDSDNNTCQCPIGTTENDNATCISLSFIRIAGDEISQSCTDLKLEALIRRDEAQAYNFMFEWRLAKSSVKTESFNAINNYLATQTSNIIFIPESMLQRNNDYRFKASYRNVLGEKFEDFIDTRTIADFIPKVNIDGGLSQSLISSQNNQIVALVSYSQCLDLRQPLQVKWTIVGGDNFDINSLYNPQTPLKLLIPKCTLKPGMSTLIKFQAWVDKFMWLSQSQIINITVLPEDFKIDIANGDREHPKNQNLLLSGFVVSGTSCLQQMPITYTWTCHQAKSATDDDPDVSARDNDFQDTGNVEDMDNIEVVTAFAALATNQQLDTSNSFQDYNNLVRFQECRDPDMIFGKQSLDPNLRVPRQYFKEGDVFHFMLVATKGLFSDTAQTEIFIESPAELALEISCENCVKYSSNQEYSFSGNVVSSLIEDAPVYYNWNIDPPLPFIAFKNQFKIPVYNTDLDQSIDFIKVTLSVNNAGNYGMANSLLPVNRPPKGGTVVVFPSSGTSLSTYFSIVTEKWVDDDLPLTYQFTYFFESEPDLKILLTEPQFTPQTSSFLPGSSPYANIILEVTAKDSLGAYSRSQGKVQVVSSVDSLEDSVEKARDILGSLEDYDPFEKLKVITVLNTEINHLEDQIIETVPSSVCPACSGHGFCLNSIPRCKCDPEWTLSDCSLERRKFDSMMSFKAQSLEEIANNSQIASSSAGKQMVYNTLKIVSENELFNTNKTLEIVENILENSLDITSNETKLSPEEATAVSQILSNIMSYSSTYDCSGETNFTAQLRNKTMQYLDKISKNSLRDKLPGENSTVINTDNFDLLTRKIKLCDLDNDVFSTSTFSPRVSFILSPDQQNNCSYEVSLQYYAFSQGLMECGAAPEEGDKTHLAIMISDANTGEELDLNVSVRISLSGNAKCPYKCSLEADGSCFCEDLSPFDVKSQIIRIFTLSQIGYLINIEALLVFDFWTTGSFWGVLVLTFWFIFTLYVVRRKWAKYDAIEEFRRQQRKTKWDVLKASFKVTHPMLNVYFLYNEDLSKTVRAVLYYNRTILLLTFTSLFTGTGATDDFLFQLIDFNIYLLLLPYFTFVPIDMITSYLIKSPPKKDLDSLSDIRKKLIAFKTRFGYTLITTLILTCLLTIAIITANQTSKERLDWTTDFIKSLTQDLILTPTLFLCVQYFYIRILEHQYVGKKQLIKVMLGKCVDPSLKIIRESFSDVSVKKIFPIDTIKSMKDLSLQEIDPVPATAKKESSSRVAEPQVSSIADTTASGPSVNKVPEINAKISKIRETIKEESFEDSPCVNQDKRRNRIKNMHKSNVIFQEEVFSKSLAVPASQYQKHRKLVFSKYPSIHQDLDAISIEPPPVEPKQIEMIPISPGIEPFRIGSKPHTDSSGTKSPKPNHSEFDSEVLSTTMKFKDNCSLNGIRGFESPSNQLLRLSPKTISSESKIELGSPIKFSTLLGQSIVTDRRNEEQTLHHRIMYLRSNTSSTMKKSQNSDEIRSERSDVLSDKSESAFEFMSLRRSRIPLGTKKKIRINSETDLDACTLDDLTKKENMHIDGEELTKAYLLESAILNSKIGRDTIREKMKYYSQSNIS